MPIGSGIVYNVGDLILSQVSSSGTAFLETKIAAATSSLIYFDSNARINSASLNSITVGTASYVSGSNSIITNITASNISASGTSSFGYVGIGTTSPANKLHVIVAGGLYNASVTNQSQLTGSVIIQADDSGANSRASLIMRGADTIGGAISIAREDTGATWKTYMSFYTNNVTGVSVTDIQEKMRLNADGNLGIGTTSPAAKLHVYNGSSHFEATSNGNAAIVAGLYALQIGPLHDRDSTAGRYYGGIAFNHLLNFGGGTTYNGAPQAWIGTRLQDTTGSERDYLVFATKPGTGVSGTGNDIPIERMCIDRDGNVGIGITVPAAKLHCYNGSSGGQVSSNSNVIAIESNGNNGLQFLNPSANNANINFGDQSDNEIGFIQYQHATDAMRFRAGGTTIMSLVSGNVGIGTTSPAAKLEISGSSNSALLNIKSPSSSTILYVSGSGAVGVGTSAYTGIGGNGYLMLKNVLCFVSDNTANSNNRNWSIGTNGQFNGDLYFVTSADSSSFPNDAYRISFTRTGDIITNGSIGIGTSNPINKLQVNGNVSGSSFTSSISNAVGFLGTSSWAQNVISASYALSSSFATTAQTANALNPANSYTITNLTASNISASLTGSFGMVGIGTTSPTQKLDVAGSAYAYNYFTLLTAATYGPSDNSATMQVFGSTGSGGLTNTIKFVTGGSERWRITDAGILQSPAAQTIQTSTGNLTLATGGGNGNILLSPNGSGNVGIGTTSPSNKTTIEADATGVSFADNSVGQLVIRGATNTAKRLGLGIDTTNNIGVIQAQLYGTGQYPLVLNPAGGNVGIGTTNATDKLTVYGELASYKTGADTIQTQVYLANTPNTRAFNIQLNSGGTGLDLWSYNSANAWLRHTTFDYDGKVGIGTATSILGKLQLDSGAAPFYGPATGSATPNGILTLGSIAGDVVNTFGVDASATAYSWIQSRKATGATFYNLALNPNGGSVGIGTVTPTAKLEISGSGNSALLNIKSPISGAILYVSGSGAVGINTNTVGAFTLQVNGSFGATTKSFIIDHPTKEGKKLMYGSLESPYHGIRLTGRDTLVNGKCKIQLPEYMYKLILHDSVNIQLTGIKCNKTLYIDDINIPENYFTIAYDKAIFESYKDYDFFWDFTAIRADVPELQTEM